MEQRHESYRGHEIVVEAGAEEALTAAAEGSAAEGSAEPSVLIDGDPVYAVRDAAGKYIAAGFAYAPQDSLVNLAKRIVDYRAAGEEADRGSQEEPSDPQPG